MIQQGLAKQIGRKGKAADDQQQGNDDAFGRCLAALAHVRLNHLVKGFGIARLKFIAIAMDIAGWGHVTEGSKARKYSA